MTSLDASSFVQRSHLSVGYFYRLYIGHVANQ
jgi:hypothetical protein